MGCTPSGFTLLRRDGCRQRGQGSHGSSASAALGPAMPFGCVTLGDKKDYNQPSEVTDRYDLGQVIKT